MNGFYLSLFNAPVCTITHQKKKENYQVVFQYTTFIINPLEGNWLLLLQITHLTHFITKLIIAYGCIQVSYQDVSA